jgi:predicted ATPase
LPNYGFKVVREQCRIEDSGGKASWFDRQENDFRTNVSGLSPSLDPSSLALPLVDGHARFSPVLRTLSAIRVHAIEPVRLREMQDPDSGTILRPDGSNTASVLQEIERQAPEDLARICEILKTIVPNTTKVHSKKHGNKLSLEFTQEWGRTKEVPI